jgi:hypothetical protein
MALTEKTLVGRFGNSESWVVVRYTLVRMIEEAKDRYDACLKLADHFMGRWDARQNLEWKMNFGVWTLLALACAALRGKGGLTICMALIIIVGFGWWLWGIWDSNDLEKRAGRHYRAEAEHILGNAGHGVRPFDHASVPLWQRLRSFLRDGSRLRGTMVSVDGDEKILKNTKRPRMNGHPQALECRTPQSGPTRRLCSRRCSDRRQWRRWRQDKEVHDLIACTGGSKDQKVYGLANLTPCRSEKQWD